MAIKLFKKQPTLAEMEEESEHLQAEDDLEGKRLSIAQKREAIRRLKERGLTPKHFAMDFGRILHWLKTH